MRRKKMVWPFILFAACTSVTSNKEQPGVNYETVNGYFLKNGVNQSTEIRTLSIADQNTFEKHFGIAKTLTNTVDTVNFEQQLLGAITIGQSEHEMHISIASVSIENKMAICQFKVKQGTKLSYTISPSLLFTISNTGVTEIQFERVY